MGLAVDDGEYEDEADGERNDERCERHVVVAKEGTKTKLIRFGQQGVSTAGKKTDKKWSRLDKSPRHWAPSSTKRARRSSSLVLTRTEVGLRYGSRARSPGYGSLQERSKHKGLSGRGNGHAFTCNFYG